MTAGRPTSYKPSYNKQAEKLCLKQAIKISEPCVYMISDMNDKIVYIGKTKNPKRRFQNYKYKTCHNILLNNWLKENEPYFVVIKLPENRLNEVEKELIKKHKEYIFNKIAGGEYPWVRDLEKPWCAGHIKSPSALLLQRLQNNKFKHHLISETKKIIKDMNNKQRCMFELEVAKDYYEKYQHSIEKWLNITECKMIECIEG